MGSGKKYLEKAKKVDRNVRYQPKEAVALLKQTSFAKFDETVDLSFKLGIDPKKTEQQVRSTVLLPHGSGKKIRVLVFAKGEKVSEATEAGADLAGSEELIQKVMDGFLDFDKVLATPDIMPALGKLGKILGTRGLMPNPKSGTVTPEIGKAVREFKSGRVEFKSDKGGCIHLPIGKVSFEDEKILNNLRIAVSSVVKVKPSSCKAIYIKSLTISTTMGPGIKLDIGELLKEE